MMYRIPITVNQYDILETAGIRTDQDELNIADNADKKRVIKALYRIWDMKVIAGPGGDFPSIGQIKALIRKVRKAKIRANPAKKQKLRKTARKLMASGSKKLAAWVRSQTKSNRGKKRKNPVKVKAEVTGKGTGWIKAKAVRVVTKGGKQVVEVKR